MFIILIGALKKLYSRPIFEVSAKINTLPTHLLSIHSLIYASCGIIEVNPFVVIPLHPRKHLVATILFNVLIANSPVRDFFLCLIHRQLK